MSETPNRRERIAVLSGRLTASRKHYPEADHSAIDTELRKERVALYIEQVVEAAPPLNAKQRRELAALIRGGSR